MHKITAIYKDERNVRYVIVTDRRYAPGLVEALLVYPHHLERERVIDGPTLGRRITFEALPLEVQARAALAVFGPQKDLQDKQNPSIS